ncbi:hypothetical protein OF83DRAFT_482560 [Amylostereum chailletii]|nr:hypothetical protein OF83DRAFT_482560 [Amylostereum chailletii]
MWGVATAILTNVQAAIRVIDSRSGVLSESLPTEARAQGDLPRLASSSRSINFLGPMTLTPASFSPRVLGPAPVNVLCPLPSSPSSSALPLLPTVNLSAPTPSRKADITSVRREPQIWNTRAQAFSAQSRGPYVGRLSDLPPSTPLLPHPPSPRSVVLYILSAFPRLFNGVSAHDSSPPVPSFHLFLFAVHFLFISSRLSPLLFSSPLSRTSVQRRIGRGRNREMERRRRPKATVGCVLQILRPWAQLLH